VGLKAVVYVGWHVKLVDYCVKMKWDGERGAFEPMK
jgi:hypothetical protein